MPEPTLPRARILDDWRASQSKDRQPLTDQSDGYIALWSGLVLVLMLLYLMIGQAPYQHEVELDPLTGAAVTSPVNRAVWLGLLALAAPVLWLRRQTILQLLKRLWPVLAIYAWFAATTQWALDPAASGRRLFLYGVNLIVVIAALSGLRHARWAHAALAVACAIIIVVDLLSWALMPARSMTVLGLAAIHNHKNTLGSVMLLCGLIIGPYVIFESRLKWRLVWSLLFLGCVLLLIGSKSKTSMAILAVAVLVTPFLLSALSLRAQALKALIASCLLGGLVLVFSWLAWSYAAGQDPLAPIRKITFTQRTDVWRFSLAQFAQHPWKGLGFASFWDVDPRVQPSLQTDEWFAQPDTYTNESHNGYIDLLVTTGVFGLLGCLFLLGRWSVRSLQLLRGYLLHQTSSDRTALAYSLYLAMFPLVFFVHNWMESSYFTANAMFGVIILLVGIDIDMRHAPPPGLPPRIRQQRQLGA